MARQSIKDSRAIEKMLNLLNAATGQPPVANKELVKKLTVEASVHSKPSAEYTAEGVLMFLQAPARFTTKPCKHCGELFGTNYRGVAYCSNACRAAELLKLGITMSAKPDGIRWGSVQAPVEPPMLIPPDVLGILQKMATAQVLASELEPESHIETWQPKQEKLQTEVCSVVSAPAPQLPLLDTPLIAPTVGILPATEWPFDFSTTSLPSPPF